MGTADTPRISRYIRGTEVWIIINTEVDMGMGVDTDDNTAVDGDLSLQ